MRNHSNIVLLKENDNSLETKLKIIEYYDLIDNSKKKTIEKLNEIREKSERQLNELKNKINKHKVYFTKEIETLINNQTEILELKTSINKMKNALESIGNRVDHREEEISKLKDRNLERT